MPDANVLGQPVGAALPDWAAPTLPPREPMPGRYCRVEPIDERLAPDLHAANSQDADGRTWTYLPYGPFATESDYRRWLTTTCLGAHPLFHAVIDAASGRAVGVAAYMRIARAETATPPGTRSSTSNGRRWRGRSRRGWTPRTSTRPAASGSG